MYGVRDPVLPLLPDQRRGHHAGAGGDPDKEIQQKRDRGRISSHRRQCLTGSKAPHHRGIRRVEDLLKNASGNHRKRKQDDLPREGTVKHIDLLTFLFHNYYPKSSSAFAAILVPYTLKIGTNCSMSMVLSMPTGPRWTTGFPREAPPE